MKRSVVVVLVALCAVATPAQAFDTHWIAFLRCTDVNGTSWIGFNPYGTGATAVTVAPTMPDEAVALYMPLPPSKFSRYITPAQPAEVTMTWPLHVTAGPDYAGNAFRLHAWNTTGATNDIGPDPGFRVVLYKGSSIEYVFDPGVNGTSGQPQWSKEYPISPGETVTDFRLVREPVPEPASAAALLSGIFGAAILRRGRKTSL